MVQSEKITYEFFEKFIRVRLKALSDENLKTPVFIECNDINDILKYTLEVSKIDSTHEVYYQPNWYFHGQMMIIPRSDLQNKFEVFCDNSDNFPGSLVLNQTKEFYNYSKNPNQPEKIELVNADVSEFDQELNANATRLLGNVVFRHQNATMYCDSAYLYRNENRIEAFNNIRIKQGDSLDLKMF